MPPLKSYSNGRNINQRRKQNKGKNEEGREGGWKGEREREEEG